MKSISLAVFAALCAATLSANPCGPRHRSYAYSIGHGHVSIAGGTTLDDFQAVKSRLGDECLWVRLEGKSYVIHDTEMLDRVRELFAPVRAMSPEAQNVEKEEEDLDRQIDALEDDEGPHSADTERLRVKLDDVHRRERALDRKEDELSCQAETKMWPLVEDMTQQATPKNHF